MPHKPIVCLCATPLVSKPQLGPEVRACVRVCVCVCVCVYVCVYTFVCFDLTVMDAEILNTLVNVSLTYHLSLADAETGQSPIASPFETQSTTIWVRATDDTTSNPVCYSVGVFDLIVEPIPDFSPTTLITIADDEIVDGLTQFNLNSYIPEITLGNPDLTVSFHLTINDFLLYQQKLNYHDCYLKNDL